MNLQPGQQKALQNKLLIDFFPIFMSFASFVTMRKEKKI